MISMTSLSSKRMGGAPLQRRCNRPGRKLVADDRIGQLDGDFVGAFLKYAELAKWRNFVRLVRINRVMVTKELEQRLDDVAQGYGVGFVGSYFLCYLFCFSYFDGNWCC